MKKFLGILVVCVMIFLSAFLIKKYHYKDNTVKSVNASKDSLNCKIKYRGLKDAVDFVVDERGTNYIAYKDRIQVIKSDGKSYDILKEKDFNISSLEYDNNRLYIASGTKIYTYNIPENKLSEKIGDIPNLGDYKESKLRIRGDYLYISIGSMTNSGVVGEDSVWIKDTPYARDVSPKDVTLKGINFGESKTGAFQSYKTKSIKGQIMPEHFPGNATIIIYNLKTGDSETFAWGIRNVTAMDFSNEGKLIAVIGGMEDRGLRPIKGDNDYIYEIKKSQWYGWPDYSGGDPVTSPKFKGKGKLQFVLENHPTTNPSSPLYQHKNLSSINALCVDGAGVIGEKNCIYFYDKKDFKLYSFNGTGLAKNQLEFNKDSNIVSVKLNEKSILVLDGKQGYLYNVEKGIINNGLKIDKNIYAYLILIALASIILLLRTQKK